MVEAGPGRGGIPVREAFEECELIGEVQVISTHFDGSLDHRHPQGAHDVDEFG